VKFDTIMAGAIKSSLPGRDDVSFNTQAPMFQADLLPRPLPDGVVSFIRNIGADLPNYTAFQSNRLV
jgi:hypothetical protein